MQQNCDYLFERVQVCWSVNNAPHWFLPIDETFRKSKEREESLVKGEHYQNRMETPR